MHPQLEILLQIQDLKSQGRELSDSEGDRTVEENEFHIDVESAVRQIAERVEELKQELPAHVRGRLERFARGAGRAVVPVINGICYGCFTAVPTASLAALGRNDNVNHCENCGRFLYLVRG
ncbi:MAG TPA: C4-type zinc ribbon domain-containing protein [Longimicrobiales bacterium]